MQKAIVIAPSPTAGGNLEEFPSQRSPHARCRKVVPRLRPLHNGGPAPTDVRYGSLADMLSVGIDVG
jgi:hypothetical protein